MNLDIFKRTAGPRVAIVVAMIALFCGSLLAQLPTATILGVVTDNSGSVVPGATVTVKNADTGLTRTASTTQDGSYRFPALPVGNYEARTTQQGFETSVVTGITLTVSQQATINFSLKVGAVEQQVTVTSGALEVNTESASLGGLVDQQKLADLPLNGRNFADLTLNETGVVEAKNVGKSAGNSGLMISTNGASHRSNNFLLDGTPMTNLYGSSSASIGGSTLGVEGIREFRILTNYFSAEYGLAMGSQVLMVSKSGTNAIHGSALEYLRNSKLDARNFFDAGTSPPPFKRNNFGGSIGGPIKKDKTFFFATYEGLQQRLGRTVRSNVMAAGCRGPAGAVITNTACTALGSTASVTVSPVIADILKIFPNPNSGNQYAFTFSEPIAEHYGQGRLDHMFSAKDSIFGRYTVDDGAQTLALAYPQLSSIGHTLNQYLTVAENHIFSPTVLNTLRFSYSRTEINNESPSGVIGPTLSLVAGQEIGSVAIGGVTTFAADGPSPTDLNQYLLNYSDDVYWTKGKHSLKFGFMLNSYDLYLKSSTNSRGSVTFSSLANFLNATASNYIAVTAGSVLKRDYKFNVMGFYVQDDYKVHRRLSLNLGLRYEPMTTPYEVDGRNAALRNLVTDTANTVGEPHKNFTLKNFSPRVGFAWDATGDGKTAVRGGFGLLYDLANMGPSFIIGVTGTQPFASTSSVATATSITLPLTFPASSLGKSQRLIDYNMKQPHLLQYNVSVQRQLPWGLAMTAAYVGSRGLNLNRTIEGNPILPTILADGRASWPNAASQSLRRNPNFNNIELKTSGANSWYNAFQIEVLKRLTQGLQFQMSYTRSKSIGTPMSQLGTDGGGGANVFDSNPASWRADRSLSDFDTPNVFRFNAIYNLPKPSFKGIAGGLLSGWWTSTIISVQNGQPFTVALNSNRSRAGQNAGAAGIDRPDLVSGRTASDITSGTTQGCSGVTAGTQLGGPNLYFDPCAFSLQPQGFLGNAGRNLLRGPGFANMDLSFVKDTNIPMLGEAGKLQFRAEMFNIFNHANFSQPSRLAFAGTSANTGVNAEAALSTAGVITSTTTTARQLQFALKLIF
ncbi:MAG: TonB-dependent receptor [Bryobacteraceae bacterium]